MLLKLADTVLILINTGPSNINILMYSECSIQPCIKAGRLEPGLYYLEVALSMDPNCLEALTSLARCQLLMGHWMDAMKVK